MNFLKSHTSLNKLPSLLNWLLVILGLWMTTNFIWSFWPQVPSQVTTTAPVTTSENTFELAKVLNANLFGAPEKVAEQTQQITAPVSRLNLKLRGVYASEDDYASAMIEHNREQEVYRIGSSLPGASGLTLYQVLSDRVIMSRNGKYETLYIQDFDGTTPTGTTRISQPIIQTSLPEPETEDVLEASTGRDVIDLSNNAEVTRQLLELRENLDDPTALADVVSMSPVSGEEGFQGFRLAPGSNRELFGRLGLRRNDIVTEVNGITMSDPSAAFTVIEQLTSADEINLTVKRGERDIQIKISAVAQ